MDSTVTDNQYRIMLERLRWNGIVQSPFVTNSKVYYCSNGQYKCRDSGKYFNVKTGTIFQNSRISIQKWIDAATILSCRPITSIALAKELQLTQKTAWNMMKKINMYLETNNHQEENSIITTDKLKLSDWLMLLKAEK